MTDPFDLQRFVDAQDRGDTYCAALDELRHGCKRTHWMWFVFPQLAGLGLSPTSARYAISGLEEARAYLRHPVLGTRLRECAAVVAATRERTAEQIFGAIDAVKLCSSMTLFASAEPGERVFREVLDVHYGGECDPLTCSLLGSDGTER